MEIEHYFLGKYFIYKGCGQSFEISPQYSMYVVPCKTNNKSDIFCIIRNKDKVTVKHSECECSIKVLLQFYRGSCD